MFCSDTLDFRKQDSYELVIVFCFALFLFFPLWLVICVCGCVGVCRRGVCLCLWSGCVGEGVSVRECL